MLKLLICATFFLSAQSLFSQPGNTIVAEGNAKMKVQPDIALIKLTIEKKDSVEKRAIKNLNTGIEELVTLLHKIGLTDKAIRISEYNVSAYNSEDGKRYVVSNKLKVEFHLDTKFINEIYKQIQASDVEDLSIEFETKISDSLENKIRTKLVQHAISNAKANAENIALALNVRIGKVKQVSKYNEGLSGFPVEIYQVKFTPLKVISEDQPINTSFDKFNVEEIEMEEKITIIYEIAK